MARRPGARFSLDAHAKSRASVAHTKTIDSCTRNCRRWRWRRIRPCSSWTSPRAASTRARRSWSCARSGTSRSRNARSSPPSISHSSALSFDIEWLRLFRMRTVDGLNDSCGPWLSRTLFIVRIGLETTEIRVALLHPSASRRASAPPLRTTSRGRRASLSSPFARRDAGAESLVAQALVRVIFGLRPFAIAEDGRQNGVLRRARGRVREPHLVHDAHRRLAKAQRPTTVSIWTIPT